VTRPAQRAYERIHVAHAGGVATIVLDNPSRRNAIGPQMINELLWALDDARGDDDVRAIVLTGEGKAFCAGGDFTAAPDRSVLPAKGDFADLLLALYKTDKPVVARVNGDAMGGGLGLAAASTFAVASTNARLGTPEIELGIFPMMIMAVLARHVPRRRLTEMMLFGERFDAAEAARLGLVNRAVAPEALDAEVEEDHRRDREQEREHRAPWPPRLRRARRLRARTRLADAPRPPGRRPRHRRRARGTHGLPREALPSLDGEMKRRRR